MRALHVFPQFPPGLADARESYAGHLTKELTGLGIAVEVLNAGRPSLPWIAKTWSALSRCDVVLAAFLPEAVLSAVMRMAKLRRKPVVMLLSLDDEVPVAIPTGAAAMLTITEESARELSRRFPNCKVVDVGAGVDPAAFDDAAISGARFRAKYDLGDRKLLFAAAGKGTDLAIDAMYFFTPGSLLLAIAGDDPGGKLPSDRVRYLGPLSAGDLWDAYDACDVFVAASPAEKWGGVFLEAWARGKPVIGNPNSYSVSSLIDDAVDGFLCDNSRTIARRVELLLDHPALCKKMGEAGRRKLMEHHTWEQVAKRVRGVFESIAAKCAIPHDRKP